MIADEIKTRPRTPDVAKIAAALGRAQRASILSLTSEWGPAASHRACRRLFYRASEWGPLVFHKHQTDNCWCLSDLGLAVQAYLKEQAHA